MQNISIKSKKADATFLVLYTLLLLFLVAMSIYTYVETKAVNVFFGMGLVIIPIFILGFFSRFILKIKIEGEYLIIKYIFTLYKTNIKNITKIRKGETMWSGLHKYGTTTKGLIIFAKYKNDLYISPENEAFFYEKLCEINPQIIIEKV